MLVALVAMWGLMTSAADFETATSAVSNMRVGWNLGNTLDSNSGDVNNMWIEAWSDRSPSAYETAWGQPVTKPELLKMFKEAGFNAIRVPVTWYPHMEATFKSVKWDNAKQGLTTWDMANDPIGTKIQAEWMKRVHEVVDYVISQGMYCILNVHHDTGDGSTAWLRADEAVYAQQKDRFEAVWTQIAEEFKDYDEHLLFEGYNEMLDSYGSWCFASFATSSNYNASVATSAYNAINNYAQSFVNAVRATGGNNAQRNLIVNTYGACSGSGTWSSHLKDPLTQMKRPTDNVSDHLIFEVHTYIDVKNISNAKKEVDQMIRDVKTNLASKGAPVIFGEWGTTTENGYDNYRSNMLAFARYFVEQAKANGMGTFYWMGLSDGSHRSVPEFNQQDLKDAIIKGYYGDQGYSGVSMVKGSGLKGQGTDTYYNLSGRRLSAPQKGLNIVRMSSGAVQKVLR
ncbi:MAG: glycoside hydrolase family 5 protein [Prevotella sp.]|nr:glycoside hydrolase family 5 protein [Prevotella sp.]